MLLSASRGVIAVEAIVEYTVRRREKKLSAGSHSEGCRCPNLAVPTDLRISCQRARATPRGRQRVSQQHPLGTVKPMQFPFLTGAAGIASYQPAVSRARTGNRWCHRSRTS